MPGRTSTSLLRIAVAALALAVPASAGATGWVTGPPVSPAGVVALAPKVAVTPSGARIVAWEELQNGTFDVQDVAVRVAPPGGDFGPAQLFTNANDEDLSLGVGADGTAALVWSDTTSQHEATLHVARLAPGDASFTEMTPAPLGSRLRDAPQVTVQGGDVYAALDSTDEQGSLIKTAIRVVRLRAGANQVEPVAGPAGLNLDQATYDSDNQPESTVTGAHIAVEGATVHVIWEDLENARGGNPNAFTFVRRSTAPLDGTFSAPIPLDTFQTSFFRAEDATPLIVSRSGRVDAVWTRAEQGQIASQELTAGAGQQNLTVSGFAGNLHAGIDRAGALVLGWQQFTNDGTESVFTTLIAPGGGPAGAIQRLTPPNANRNLDDFVVGPDGSALALPDRLNDESFSQGDEQVQAAFRAPGVAFGSLEEVSGVQDRTGVAASDGAAAALGADGTAVAAWSADDGSGVTNERIFVSQRDATPPAIGSLAIPESAVVGSPTVFSAAATDTLSPASIEWSFGDGAGARGTSVHHTYLAPGAYTVTVSARDAAGNVAVQTRTITVGVPSDSAAPVITQLHTLHARFRAATGSTADIAAGRSKAPFGTTFTLSVNERSTLVISLAGRIAGRRAGTHCVAGARRGRPCAVRVSPGTLVRVGRGPGAVSIPFTGRLDGTRLLPGSYSATVVAIDAAGNRSQPKAVSFTVVAR
ncbi:MAG TPA: PKD domain-containing protein [Solirubrobacteraceae bacterium]|nr:PKD domain-containing protein [Solirubrobacteraceae bacterium]